MSRERVVLVLCRCGGTVGDSLDVDALAEWAAGNPAVERVLVHDKLCETEGKAFLEAVAKEAGDRRIVVAACSPRQQQRTFEDCLVAAGSNPGRLAMANIREQCAWVTTDREKAAEKARRLVQAALERVVRQVDLERRHVECSTDLVVIGGGIAGVEAALQAAEAGRKVTLFEKEIALGGEMVKVEDLAPAGICSARLVGPRLAELKANPNATVVVNAEVTDILGNFGNFTVVARRKARFVTDDCIGCEACFEPCPVEVSSDFHLGLGKRKAVYNLYHGSMPTAAAVDPAACLHLNGEDCDACVRKCPFRAIDFSQRDEIVEARCGAVVLAIGAEVHVPRDIPRLGCDGAGDVYTYAEFERLASSNGPTRARLQRRDGRIPSRVAVVHCAGSLCSDGLSWCSGVCCVNALMVGRIVRQQIPKALVTNIHDRLVFPGPEAETFLQEQIRAGTRMVACKDLEKLRVERLPGGELSIAVPGLEEPVVADMVVLSTGFVAGERARDFAEMLNAELDAQGFLKNDHSILKSLGSLVYGVSMAGSCGHPCHGALAVTMAHASVGRALSWLVPGRVVEREMLVARIDPDRCAGCRMCVATCPYKAISYDKELARAVVDEAICRGCGTCAATCPSKAIMALGFTDGQLLAEIGGTLHGGV